MFLRHYKQAVTDPWSPCDNSAWVFAVMIIAFQESSGDLVNLR